MSNEKVTAKEVAKWFIDRAAQDVKAKCGEYLTQLKLQKLMYYAKGFYYVFEDEKLFDAGIFSQKYGPVVNELVGVLKEYGNGQIKKEFSKENNIKNEKILYVLEFVYKFVAQYSAGKLIDFTHAETPWQQTVERRQISEDLIKEYFRSNYLENFNENNQLNIKQQDIFNAAYLNILNTYKPAFEELAQ